MKTFRESLEHWMTVRGHNPKSLAKAAGMAHTGVSDIIKNGKSKDPKLSTIIKLSRALRVLPHVLSPELAELYPSGAAKILARLEQIYGELVEIEDQLTDDEPPRKGKK